MYELKSLKMKEDFNEGTLYKDNLKLLKFKITNNEIKIDWNNKINKLEFLNEIRNIIYENNYLKNKIHTLNCNELLLIFINELMVLSKLQKEFIKANSKEENVLVRLMFNDNHEEIVLVKNFNEKIDNLLKENYDYDNLIVYLNSKNFTF